MSGCEEWCIAFIWVSFFWPVIVSVVFILFRPRIIRKAKYFLISTLVGYGVKIGANFFIVILVRFFIDLEEIEKGADNLEVWIYSFVGVTLLILYTLPVITSHLLVKRFS